MVPGVWCCTSHVQKVCTLFVFLRVVLWLCGDGAGAGVGGVGVLFSVFSERVNLFSSPVFCDKFLLRK
jgi:hypothetical protein